MRASRLISLGLMVLLASPVDADPPRDMGYRKSAPTHSTPPPAPSRGSDNRFGFTKPQASPSLVPQTPQSPQPQVQTPSPTQSPQGDTRFGFTKPSQTTPDDTRSGFTKPNQTPSAIPTPPQGDTRFGFTKPSQTTPSQDDNRSGFTKPGQSPTQPPPVAAQRSAADQAIAKTQSKRSLAAFEADQKRYTAPPIAAPTTTQAAKESSVYQQYGRRWNSPDEYYTARRASETRLPPQVNVYYTNPPGWISQGPPSYGNFSSAFLGAIVGMAGTRLYDQWAYSHWNDPGVQAWREDMSRQAQNDAELRAKLDTLNAKVTELQAQKAPVTEALPEGIDPSLVVAPRTVMLATASSGFNWWWIGVPVLILVILVLLSLKIANDRRRIV